MEHDWRALLAVYRSYAFSYCMTKIADIGSKSNKFLKDRND